MILLPLLLCSVLFLFTQFIITLNTMSPWLVFNSISLFFPLHFLLSVASSCDCFTCPSSIFCYYLLPTLGSLACCKRFSCVYFHWNRVQVDVPDNSHNNRQLENPFYRLPLTNFDPDDCTRTDSTAANAQQTNNPIDKIFQPISSSLN